MARTYAWLATGGGAWSLASNWDDVTDGLDPSPTAPGAQDTAEIAGASGSAIGTITGPGQAAVALFSGNIALSGSFAFGSLSLGAGGVGGLLAIGAGASVAAGGAQIGSGSLLASGAGAALSVAGSLVLGAGQSGTGAASCALQATNGGTITAASLVLDASSAAVFVDAASVLDVGGNGGSARGVLTVEAGAELSGFGNADAYGSLVNAGTIAAAGGELMLGATSGTGQLQIGAGAILDLNGRVGAGQAVMFAGAGGTLALAAEIDAPGGAISGFAIGDAIDELGSPISAAAYAATGNDTGVLTLLYGGQVADTFTLLGNYANDTFLVSGDGAGGSLITLAASGSGGGTLSGGTGTPDNYVWTAANSGAWDNRLNWADTSSGDEPAKVAPGLHDLVSIAAPSSQFLVVGGPGDAALLAVSGELALAGNFGIATLALGVGGGAPVSGTLDLLPGSTLTAASAAIADGALSVVGSASLFTVTGTIALGGGVAGVGLPVTSLSAASGASVELGGLTMGGGSGNAVTTDPTARIEIGDSGGAAAGAITIDAGYALSGNGQVNPFGNIVDNGTVDAEGGTLTLGSVAGGGVLTIGAGAALQLGASTSTGITFAGAASTLLLENELVAPTGTITGFTLGDTIDIQGDPITSFAYAAGSGGGAGTLTLFYDGTAVARLLLAGSYAGDKFVLAPDGANGTDVLVAKGSGGGGGGGQGSTDLLAWTNPVSGAWNRAANWTDVTTGMAATAPPGAQNAALITGPMDGSFQVVAGPAACASATFLGDTALTQSYSFDTLTVGNASTAGELALLSGATLATGGTAVANGEVLVEGQGVAWTVQGVLALGGGAAGQGSASTLVSAGNSAIIQAAGLVLGGGIGDALSTDATGWIEIGAAGGAAAGAITVDASVSVAGNGSLNAAGNVVDNGAISAQGGTLLLGNTSGVGTLAIAAEAVLALNGSETVPISFTGSGATLLLEGIAGAPTGVISGFVQGDEIVTGNSLVTGVSYAPGAGGIGKLTLQYAGQSAAVLLLAGNYAGDTFSVLPDGAGSAIVVSGSGGASGGTTTPDHYLWTGADANGQWNDAGNWQDVTAGQNPAAVAPGLNDLVTVQGGSAGTAITGPANAASLDLLGGVSLSGSFAVGALSVGGTLALGPQGTLTAASAAVAGDVLGSGGTLSCSGTLALASGAVLAATRGAELAAGALLLEGGAAITDSSGAVVVGGTGGVAGAVLVDPGGVLAGTGSVNQAGGVIDDGEILAEGGMLALGAVSGDGLLEIGVGATLALQAGAAGVVIDFAGGGTLSIAAGQAPQAAIADFTSGDAILLPVSGVTGDVYAQTGAGIGTLTLYAGDNVVDTLTLLGVAPGQTFLVQNNGDATEITTEPGNSGTGGGMGQQGNYTNGPEDPTMFLEGLPYYQQYWVGQAIGVGSSLGPLEPYIQVSPDGSTWGAYQPGYANVGIVQSASPDQQIVMPNGYVVLLAQGSEPLVLIDWNGLPGVVVGNAGVDTIVGDRAGETLVGGVGPGTEFWAAGSADTVIGNGNDTIATGNGDYNIQTSLDRSVVFLGPGHDQVTSQGRDTIVCTPGICEATVTASGSDTVFGPASGMLNFIGGAGANVVVANSGALRFYGGSGNGSVLWANSASEAQYIGGSGAAVVVGGSGALDVEGGAGAITVFGGTGQAYIQGAVGPSIFVVGEGSSTVLAATGNEVWLAGGANNTLVASGGDVLLAGQGSFGNNTYWAGTGPTTVFAGHGSDDLMAGAGASTMVGGSGTDVFGFVDGPPHGAERIDNFQVGRDLIGLYGYAGGVNAVLATEKVVGGNTFFTLPDGTQVELTGVSGLSANSFVT